MLDLTITTKLLNVSVMKTCGGGHANQRFTQVDLASFLTNRNSKTSHQRPVRAWWEKQKASSDITIPSYEPLTDAMRSFMVSDKPDTHSNVA